MTINQQNPQWENMVMNKQATEGQTKNKQENLENWIICSA